MYDARNQTRNRVKVREKITPGVFRPILLLRLSDKARVKAFTSENTSRINARVIIIRIAYIACMQNEQSLLPPQGSAETTTRD